MTGSRRALAGLLLLAACAGCGGSPAPAPVGLASPTASSSGAAQGATPGTASPGAAPPGAAPSASATEGLLGSSSATLDDLRAEQDRRPVSVLVPGEDDPAPIEAYTTDPVSGGLALPDDAVTVAWWGGGTAPGEGRGTVVLAAHVSYQQQTGPFTKLAKVRAGAPVVVRSADGATHRYAVVSTRSAPKTALDREALFGSSGPPALVLVTCGGEYDEATHSFEDNVVVTARPV